MIKAFYRSILANVILIIILCGAYPLTVTLLGHAVFSDKADGSLVVDKNGAVVGSHLIGQGFSKPEYFHSRPSSAGDKGYDASNSSGSNLGPTNPKFYDAVKSNIDSFLKDNPSIKKGEVPTDMVTASASGLDPHISPQAAFAQAERVAQARKMSPEQARALIEEHIEGPQWGIFGEPVVNVLDLNLALDKKVVESH
jgi:K+-transporting ATPase ATPase C chain